MNPVLMQMQPRVIPEVIATVEQNITIPRVRFRAFTERQVVHEMNVFVRQTNYSHYIVCSDDALLYRRAFENIIENAPNYDCYTGWCNMEMYGKELSSHSNVCFQPLILMDEYKPRPEDYPPWEPVDKVLSETENFKTSIASFAMSCFTRDLLLKYPLMVWENGKSSDHHISYRFWKAGVEVWSNRNAFVRHLRQGSGIYLGKTKSWLVGKEEPKIIYELEPEQYEYDGERQYEYEPLFIRK